MTGYIYSVSKNDAVFYIGSTFGLHKRRKDHLDKLSNLNNISFHVIEEVECENKLQLIKQEYFWIEQFRQWGFDLVNANGNISNKNIITYTCIAKPKRVCLKCGEAIKRRDKWVGRASGNIQHRNCLISDEY